ncbi:MAG: hypothetical protein ACJ770_12410 [Gemmatimonadaceae bacterium]
MRLFCRPALLAAVVSMLACHSLAAPPALPADFALKDIDGRSLPTYVSWFPESPTVISATVHLDGLGTATITEHRLQMAGGDVTVTSSYTYAISGNAITFNFDCPANANCVAPPKGTISGSRLSLDMSGGGSHRIFYNYLLASD